MVKPYFKVDPFSGGGSLANNMHRKPRIKAQTQNLAHMAHRNPPRRHPFPPGRYPTSEMAQRSGQPHLKLRAIKSECCAHNSRNTVRDHLGTPRAITSESAWVPGSRCILGGARPLRDPVIAHFMGVELGLLECGHLQRRRPPQHRRQ
jgi:hypothetical protein